MPKFDHPKSNNGRRATKTISQNGSLFGDKCSASRCCPICQELTLIFATCWAQKPRWARNANFPTTKLSPIPEMLNWQIVELPKRSPPLQFRPFCALKNKVWNVDEVKKKTWVTNKRVGSLGQECFSEQMRELFLKSPTSIFGSKCHKKDKAEEWTENLTDLWRAAKQRG